MYTKREHVKVLAKNVVSRLEQDESIVLNPRMRQMVYQDLYQKIAPYVVTDEEIRERVLKELGMKAEQLADSRANESDQFKAARSVLLNKIGENSVMGLYYQQPIKHMAQMIGKFLMGHTQVEDVFRPTKSLKKRSLI